MNNSSFIIERCCSVAYHRDDAPQSATTVVPILQTSTTALNNCTVQTSATLSGAHCTYHAPHQLPIAQSSLNLSAWKVWSREGLKMVFLKQKLFCIFFTHLTMGMMARERNYQSRPSSSGGGDLSDLLDGVELNLLDSKLIGIGFVREELVEEVCLRATR